MQIDESKTPVNKRGDLTFPLYKLNLSVN